MLGVNTALKDHIFEADNIECKTPFDTISDYKIRYEEAKFMQSYGDKEEQKKP